MPQVDHRAQVRPVEVRVQQANARVRALGEGEGEMQRERRLPDPALPTRDRDGCRSRRLDPARLARHNGQRTAMRARRSKQRREFGVLTVD
jgi:hypothetical protein